MATLVVTNVDSAPVLIQDFYATIPVGGSITVSRGAGDLSGMPSLHSALAAGTVTMTVTYSSDELASGLVNTDNAAAASAALAGHELLRVSLVAGGGGADDVTVFAAGSLPYKMRVVDAWGLVDTNAAGTWNVRDEAAGAGSLAASIDSTAAGRVPMDSPTVSVAFTPGATKGLFVRRSDNTTAGEVFILVRKES